MKYIRIILFIIPLFFVNNFSQQLPDFTVSNIEAQGRYFSMLFLIKEESKQIGDDYLFTSIVNSDENDTIITDTLFFGFNQDAEGVRIKKISLSRSGVEYFSIDSFPASDKPKWKLVETGGNDSIKFYDSLLDIKLTTGKAILNVKLGKKYIIVKKDTFKIVLDNIPLRMVVDGVSPRLINSNRTNTYKNNKNTIYIKGVAKRFPLEERSYNELFNLSGKKQSINKATVINIERQGQTAITY